LGRWGRGRRRTREHHAFTLPAVSSSMGLRWFLCSRKIARAGLTGPLRSS
jgi:hypothetical protein